MQTDITFSESLLHYECPLVVTALDDAGATFVGLSYGEEDVEGRQMFAMAQVDPGTVADFVCGRLDLLTLLEERQAGLLLTLVAFGEQGERAQATVVTGLPAAAMPRPGMYMPTQPRSFRSSAVA